ncbi:MAG: N-acetylglucosamine-6-phosphate deacetylase, partial [Clostridia bacterium]|nr:N-acetylglucosamine-6-phosphate deacetylase [Clostridia bacterium]
MKTAVVNGRIVHPDGILCGYAILIENGKISAIVSDESLNLDSVSVIDAHNNYISAGWIDIHTHGIAGEDFMDADPEANLRAMRAYAQHGVTGVFPTTLSAPFSEIRQALDALARTDFS